MAVMTLTEFNQRRSRALRMADSEDVLVLRDGVPAYRLSRIATRPRTLDALVQSGLASLPKGEPTPVSELPILNCEIDPFEYSLAERGRQRGPLLS